MALATCARCKQLFTKIRSVVCPKCQPDEDADVEKVRRSLDEKTNQSAEEVSERTGVSRECIMRLVDEGRVMNVGLTKAIPCGRCGAPAISLDKKLCQACLKKLNLEVIQAQSQIKLPPKKKLGGESGSGGVHDSLDSKRRR